MEPGATPTETAPAPPRRRLWLAHAYLWLSGLLTLVVLLEANGATYDDPGPRVVAILLACIVLGLPFASVVLSRGRPQRLDRGADRSDRGDGPAASSGSTSGRAPRRTSTPSSSSS